MTERSTRGARSEPAASMPLEFPTSLLIPFLSFLFLAAPPLSHALTVRVNSGYQIHPNGTQTWVGRTTSALQGLIDTTYPTITSAERGSITHFDSTNLRYLELSGGEYEADSELRIPDLFVLRLGRYDDITGINISSTPDPNPYLTSEPSLVSFQNVRYSALVGGYIDAGGNETWEAINVYESSFCVISGVRAFADGENIINIHKGTGHLVSDSFVDGRNKAGRCVWLLATSNAMVFGNRIVRW